MSTLRTVLIYNVYPLNNWKKISNSLLSNVPHKDIVIHINIPKRNPLKALAAYNYFNTLEKVKKIIFSVNFKSKGESIGFNAIRKKIDFGKYDVATYIHSKGSSRKRKHTQPIIDWTEMLRYFMVERLDLSLKEFEAGVYLCGVNLKEKHLSNNLGEALFPESKFHFSGNFVTINLGRLRTEFLNKNCRSHYYGVEVFWGTLCDISKAKSLHMSNVNHYKNIYPSLIYKHL